jgi:hypothetical protein
MQHFVAEKNNTQRPLSRQEADLPYDIDKNSGAQGVLPKQNV